MASADDLHRERAVFDSGASDDTDSDDSSDAPSAPSAAVAPNPSPNPNDSAAAAAPGPQNGEIGTPSAERKRRRILELDEIRAAPMPLVAMDDSRRLFQRLFTDEDEITILQGFLEFVSQRGTTHASYQYDTGPFYDQIKAKLQLDFSKSQLVEKLRRLKKKYRTAVARMNSGRSSSAFKSPHDRAAFEISRQIWSPTFKRPRDQRAEAEKNNVDLKLPKQNPDPAEAMESAAAVDEVDHKTFRSARCMRERSGPVEVAVEGLATPTMANNHVVEETVRSCLMPLFKELLSCAVLGPGIAGGGGAAVSSGLSPSALNVVAGAAAGMDDKWRKQQIMELEVYAKRMELVKEQIELKLAELKSKGGS